MGVAHGTGTKETGAMVMVGTAMETGLVMVVVRAAAGRKEALLRWRAD